MYFRNLLAQSLLWRSFYFISLFVTNILLSRLLEAGNAGWVYYLTSIFSFIQLIASVSLESGLTFFVSGKLINHNKLAWLSLLWTAVIASIVFLAMKIYFQSKPGFISETQRQYASYAFCYVGGIMLINFGTVLFYAQRNFFIPNIILTAINIVFSGVLFACLKIPSLLSYENILSVYFSWFLIQGLLLFLFFIIKNRSWQMMQLPGSADLKKIFRYSFIALAGNVIFFLVYRIDYWFVQNSIICTKEDLGNYIQASKMGQLLLVIPQIIASAVFPQVASGLDRQEVNTSIMILARLFSLFFIAVFIAALLFGQQFFPMLFGSSFKEMNLPFLILVPGIFSLSVLTILSAYFGGVGKVKINVAGAFLALVFVIIGDYFFIPKYGIIAAALVSAIGYSINLSYALFHFYKDYDLNTKQFFAWQKNDFRWLKKVLIKQ